MEVKITTTENEEIVQSGCIVTSANKSIEFHIADLTFRFSFANDDRGITHYKSAYIPEQNNKGLEITFYNIPIGDNQIGNQMLNLGHFDDKTLSVKLAFTRARVDNKPDDIVIYYTWYKQI